MTTRVGSGRSAPRPGEQAREGRDDLPQNDADDAAGDDDDRDRVDHRRLHLAGQLDGLLDVGREPLENRVEDAARLAGGDHVREQRVERLRVLSHGVSERLSAFDVGSRLEDHGREVLVLLLAAENVEALHERQPRVDHHRELPDEHRQVLGRDLLPELPRLRGLLGRRLGLRLGRRDPRHHDLLAPKGRDGSVHRVGRAFTAHRLSSASASRIGKCRHKQFSLTSRGAPPSAAHALHLLGSFSLPSRRSLTCGPVTSVSRAAPSPPYVRARRPTRRPRRG